MSQNVTGLFLLLYLLRPEYKSQIAANLSEAPPIYYKNLLVFALNAMLVVTRWKNLYFNAKSENPPKNSKNQPRIFLGKDLDKEVKIGQG